ncbi:MAG: DUF1294 domain-containing protein, partial [Proteobacteria bacterium]|nr:DUF1294 domain-containing protein [Pseudomonadota bacterium]
MMALLAYLVLVNLIACVVFLIDKRQARRGLYRLSERSLLLLCLLGGSLGAFVGMQLMQHKTHKRWFQMQFQSILLMQVAGLTIVNQL